MQGYAEYAFSFIVLLLPGWRNGVRRGLKILGRKACGFDSHPGYYKINIAMRCMAIFISVRSRGIEPRSRPWQGRVLPLNHDRNRSYGSGFHASKQALTLERGFTILRETGGSHE